MTQLPPQNQPPVPPPAQPPIVILPQARLEDSAGMRMLLPVGRSGLAIAAGYVGLISILLIPAPFALLLGILAVLDIRKSKASPQPKHGMGRAIFGIVMGGIFTPLLLLVVAVMVKN
jgi:hypothetical protein